jgi:putative transposase
MQILIGIANARYTPSAIAMRAKIILLIAQGTPFSIISKELKISHPPLYKWRDRWMKAKPDLDRIETEKTQHNLKLAIEKVLKDAQRPGAPATFSEVQVLQIIALACTPPSTENLPISHWSCRLLAEYAKKKGIVKGISPSQVYIFLKSGSNKASQSKMLVKF